MVEKHRNSRKYNFYYLEDFNYFMVGTQLKKYKSQRLEILLSINIDIFRIIYF